MTSHVLLLTTLSIVQTPGGNPSLTALPAPEAEVLRGELHALARAVGVDPVPAPAAEAPEKNMAEVADKALDLATGTVGRMAETLQKVAPDIWRIMIRQQYARVAGDLLTPTLLFVALLVAGCVLTAATKRRWAKDPRGDNELTFAFTVFSVIAWIVFAICTCILAIEGGDAVKRLINPEYYAIRDLVLVLLGRGAV